VKIRRILGWLGVSIAFLFVLVIVYVAWVFHRASEGVIETETLQGNVLVALSDGPAVMQGLLSGCRPTGSLPASVTNLLASGRLAEVPSGTRMNMSSWGGSAPGTGTMTVAEGRLKGRQVWVCSGQFALLYSWP